MAIAKGPALRGLAAAVSAALVIASVVVPEAAVLGLFGMGTLLLVTRWPYVGRSATGRPDHVPVSAIVIAVVLALVSCFLVFAWPTSGLKVLAGLFMVASLANVWRDMRVRRGPRDA